MTWGVPSSISAAIRQPAPAAPSTFAPWTPPPANSVVAAGYYDPALLAQLGNAQTAYTRLGSDTTTLLQQLQGQYGIDVAGVNRQAGDSVADARTAMARGTEDRATALGDLKRNYQMLAGQQLQTGNKAGVLRGGAMLQAAAKRAANETHDQQPIETNYNRGQEDAQTAIGRAQAAQSAALGQLGFNLHNQSQQASTTLDRAGQDLPVFQQQTQASIGYQAQQNGFLPPAGATRPTNEFTNPAGQTYRVNIEGNNAVARLPNGTVLWTRPRSGS